MSRTCLTSCDQVEFYKELKMRIFHGCISEVFYYVLWLNDEINVQYHSIAYCISTTIIFWGKINFASFNQFVMGEVITINLIS